MESKDWVTLAIAAVGWGWALYQQIVSLQARRPHYVMKAIASPVQPGQIHILVTVRNRAPLDLYLHSVEILSPIVSYLLLAGGSFYEEPTNGVGQIPLNIHLPAWADGEFPSEEFELVLTAIPSEIDEVCLRVISSRRSDARKPMPFKDCLVIQR
jgi:hypothetical protein